MVSICSPCARWLRFGRSIWAMLALLTILISEAAASEPRRVSTAGAGDSIPDFIANSALVLRGRVLTIFAHGYRDQLGGCGLEMRLPCPVFDARVVVERCYQGVCPQETAAVVLLDVQSPRQAVQVGDRLLMWGGFMCTDGGNLWLNYAGEDKPSGRYRFQSAFHPTMESAPHTYFMPDPMRTSISAVPSQEPEIKSLSDSSDAVAVYPISRIVGGLGESVAILSRDPYVIIGARLPLPTIVVLPSSRNCSRDFMVGDSVVVFMQMKEGVLSPVQLARCYASLKLDHGFVPYFGEYLRNISRKLTMTPTGSFVISGFGGATK